MRAYRWLPLVDALPWVKESPLLFVDVPVRLSGQFFPLGNETVKKDEVDAMTGKRLGSVEADQGNAAVVSSTGELETLPGGTFGLGLGFAGLARPGDYAGEFDFDPDTEGLLR